MKKRPTIALAMIMKNEGPNIGPLLDSVSGCFDGIFITDTGSTDNTVEILKSLKAREIAGCPIHVSEFQWCDDFSKARQFSFDQVSEDFDFIMWLDADDSLSSREAFCHFRDHTLHVSDMWVVPYQYAFDHRGNPVCTFLRERIVRRACNFRWKFFLHEGLVGDPSKKLRGQTICSWQVKHRRTQDDLRNDRGRNLRIFEVNKAKGNLTEPRMLYYYGKELHDGSRYLESIQVLSDVITRHGKELEPHDRLMAIQYLSMSYGECEKWPESLTMALQGLHLHPERAEFWNLAANAHLKMGKIAESVPFYEGARRCAPHSMGGATYTDPNARLLYPTAQLCTIYKMLSNLDAMEKEGEILKTMEPEAGERVIQEARQLRSLAAGPNPQDLIETEDVMITCPPEIMVTDWDENALKEKGMGGSETACIEIAKFIRQKTGRPVKVFNVRKRAEIMDSGVEYIPVTKVQEYIFKYKPKAHLAWRHTASLFHAPTYVWSHDLTTPGGEDFSKYEKYICLSGFHKEFIRDLLGVPEEKIAVLSNGINPNDFQEKVEKNPRKIIFSSSPDRGLERCIEIVKRARDMSGLDLELHVFYGFENMKKFGMSQEAERLEKMIQDNEFVHYHGFVGKKELTRHFMESAVWLYPADFVETSCISAMEALCSGAYPLVRNMGALPYTLKNAIEGDMATILDCNASCKEEYQKWAEVLSEVIRDEKWRKVEVNPHDYSWEKAAEGFIELMGL